MELPDPRMSDGVSGFDEIDVTVISLQHKDRRPGTPVFLSLFMRNMEGLRATKGPPVSPASPASSRASRASTRFGTEVSAGFPSPSAPGGPSLFCPDGYGPEQGVTAVESYENTLPAPGALRKSIFFFRVVQKTEARCMNTGPLR